MTNTKIATLLTKAIMESTQQEPTFGGNYCVETIDGEMLKAKIEMIVDVLEGSDEN